MIEHTAGWHPRHQNSDPARLVAFDALRAVNDDGAYANLVLPDLISRARLRKLDASFATNLAYGTLRMRGRWDAIIARCTHGRMVSEIDPPVLDLLRLGCHQLLDFRTPPHAAINETVVIARNELGQGTAGFVNAVLRRVNERKDQWEAIIRETTASNTEFLAVWYSHPRWVVEALERSLVANGRDEHDIEAVLQADNTPAKVALVARDISSSQLQERIAAAHMEAAEPYLMPNAVLLESGDPGRLWPVQDGSAGVQDEGSQLVAAIAATAPLSGSDELWLDMCSGPGGKAATMAAIGANRGARIHANELHGHRLDLVAQAVRPWDDIVALREGDGRDLGAEEPNTYDRILVDAPCSGIGALRRRPESRWNKQRTDIPELVTLQNELLESAFRALRPGGILTYSTCSPIVEETRSVVETLLAAHPDAQVRDAQAVAHSVALHAVGAQDGMVQLWPDTDQTDGMFIALITKEGK